MNSSAVFGNVEALFRELMPDPERPESLGIDGPQWMYASLTEGVIDSGVWTSDVGGWDEASYAVDEVMVILDGRLRITNADGSEHVLTAGDMFYLPKGWSGRWDVLEAMKKIYFIVG